MDNESHLVKIDKAELQRLKDCESAWDSVYMALTSNGAEPFWGRPGYQGLTGHQCAVKAIHELQAKVGHLYADIDLLKANGSTLPKS